MMPNDWSLDGRGRRVFARLDVMRSVNQCAERALRGKAGLLARLEAHGVSNRQAARIIRVSGQAFGSWGAGDGGPTATASRKRSPCSRMVRAGDLAPEPGRERPGRKPVVLPGMGHNPYAGLAGGGGAG